MDVIEIVNDLDFDELAARVSNTSFDAEREKAIQAKTDATRVIVDAVRDRGDAAIVDFTERFDGVSLKPEQFEIPARELDQALDELDGKLRKSLERAHTNIHAYHAKNLRKSWQEESPDGTILGQRIAPIESAGVYVPGGKAFYPSSVLMNIVPARVAGVEEIVMVSPPSFDGTIHPVVLAAARLAGATRVFRIGGAQAVAALAYGTETIPSVVKITGPGNTFVTVAKRLVRTVCDIDTEAGPSEVVVIADEKADPRFAAAELLAQAEHDEEAECVLITTSVELVARVEEELKKQMLALGRGKIMGQALEDQGLIVIVRDLEEAARLTDLFAPEHLAVLTEDPLNTFSMVNNAGAAMLGPYTSVAMGDYFAGPNHILPTGRRARYASPLTAEEFRKVTSIIMYSKERLEQDADDIIRLATAEELTAHASAVEIRK